MEFSLKFKSKDSDEKFTFTSRVCALDWLAETRAAIGVDVPVDRISDEIEEFNDYHVRRISEAEAQAFGGYENRHSREILVDGSVQKYRKVKYNYIMQRKEGTDSILFVTPAFYLDFDALLEDWKAAGCPDTLTIERN